MQGGEERVDPTGRKCTCHLLNWKTRRDEKVENAAGKNNLGFLNGFKIWTERLAVYILIAGIAAVTGLLHRRWLVMHKIYTRVVTIYSNLLLLIFQQNTHLCV